MIVLRSAAALLFLVSSSCDTATPEPEPEPESAVRPSVVQPLSLEIRSCPKERSLSWTFEFGLAPDGGTEVEAIEWPGGYSYSMTGPNSGAGGGASFARCGASYGSGPCPSSPVEQTARRWRISRQMDGVWMPDQFRIDIEAPPGLQPDVFAGGGPTLGAHFDLERIDPEAHADCTTLSASKRTE